MRTIFADTFYWIALIDPHDQWHARAVAVSRTLGQHRLVTSDDVLVEVLNFFAGYGARLRANAAQAVQSALANPGVETVVVTQQDFLAGLNLYENRLDKGYSLTDCTSMNAMRARGITEILTHDRHFAQEGFIILL